jgi:hypothetical protein
LRAMNFWLLSFAMGASLSMSFGTEPTLGAV